MAIESLPPELTVAIAEFLDPYSSLDFALTSKAHWTVCETIIRKHKRCFAENHVIDALDDSYPHENFILWDKLREMMNDAVVGEYVRDFSLPISRPNCLGNDGLPQEDFDLFSPLGSEIAALYQDGDPYGIMGRGSWDDYLGNGSEEPIIVMLVHRMPYLRSFRFTDGSLYEVFEKCLTGIAKAYNNPVLAPKLPFQHLTTVAVAHWRSEGACDLFWCWFFCAIPSVRNFVAEAMSGELSYDIVSPDDLPKSNARELLLHGSRIDSRGFEQILGNMPFLEKLSYEAGTTMVNDMHTHMPRDDVRAIVENSGHSLRHLLYDIPWGLDEYSEDDLPQVSLRDFQQLETLRIDWHILWPNDEPVFDDEELPHGDFYQDEPEDDARGDFDVRSLLPASLEKLHLTGAFTEEEKKLVTKIRDGPSEFTPRLKSIYIDDGSVGLQGEVVPDVHQNPLMKYLDGQGGD